MKTLISDLESITAKVRLHEDKILSDLLSLQDMYLLNIHLNSETSKLTLEPKDINLQPNQLNVTVDTLGLLTFIDGL